MQLLHMHGTARAPLTNRRAKFVKELDVDRVNRTGGMLTVVDGGVGKGDHGHMSGPVGRFDERRMEMLMKPGVGQEKRAAAAAAAAEEKKKLAEEKKGWFGGWLGGGGGEGRGRGRGGGRGKDEAAGGERQGPRGPLSSSRGWQGPVRRAQDVAALRELGGGIETEGGRSNRGAGKEPGTGTGGVGVGGASNDGKKKGKDDDGDGDVSPPATRLVQAVSANDHPAVPPPLIDAEDGLEFAALYQRLWGDHGARGAVRTAATAGLHAIRVAGTQRRQLEEAERAREREERKRQKKSEASK